jgi:hypothetical protein
LESQSQRLILPVLVLMFKLSLAITDSSTTLPVFPLVVRVLQDTDSIYILLVLHCFMHKRFLGG